MHLLTSLLIGSITAADHHKFLPAQFPGSAQIANLSSTSQFLPNDFMWGYASASFQVEGAVSEDGKTASIWDTFASVQGKIKNGDSPKIANDEYHRFAETVRLLKESGAKSYRMSISWPRLVPGGVRGSKVNQLAVQHYNHAFDLLLQNGIEPFVTLYHWYKYAKSGICHRFFRIITMD